MLDLAGLDECERAVRCKHLRLAAPREEVGWKPA